MLEKKLWEQTLTFYSDDNNGLELEIFNAPNQDLYISIIDNNRKNKNTVRVCRSGGISTNNPRFMSAATEMYRSLAEPIEMFIHKADKLSNETGQEYFILMIRNAVEIRTLSGVLDEIDSLYDIAMSKRLDDKIIDKEIFTRITKYKIVKYSTP